MKDGVQHYRREDTMHKPAVQKSQAGLIQGSRASKDHSGLQHVPGLLPAPWCVPDLPAGFGTGLPRSAHIPGAVPELPGAGHVLSLPAS